MALPSERRLLKLEKVEYYWTVIFSIAWLALFAFSFDYLFRLLMHSTGKKMLFVLAIYAFTLLNIYQLIWMFWGEITINVSGEGLIIKYKLFFVSKTKKYLTSKISGLRLKNDAQSSSYGRFLGMKIYGKTSALSFRYIDSEEIQIKGYLSESDIQLLKDWVKN